MKRLRKLKIPKPTRALSKREKFLLALLGISIIFLLIFRFIIGPQYNRLQNLTEHRDEYSEKISQMNSLLQRE
ncbi:MAG: hypothetical protein GX329_05065, partial [Tissierellia bacterium]|nr:hypothetical protein [Tissierellia bacterium]